MQRRVQVRSTDATAGVCSRARARARTHSQRHRRRQRNEQPPRTGRVFIFLAEIRQEACPGSREGVSPVASLGDALNVKYGQPRGWDGVSGVDRVLVRSPARRQWTLPGEKGERGVKM